MSDNDKAINTVPCISICLPDLQCPHGADECKFNHNEPCLYSTGCRMLQDVDHCSRFYHPQGACRAGANCHRSDDNHWVKFSHPCCVQNCQKASIGRLNGWVCGYHYRRMTMRHAFDKNKTRQPVRAQAQAQAQPQHEALQISSFDVTPEDVAAMTEQPASSYAEVAAKANVE